MSISLFSVVILLIFATIAAIEIYRGVTRGFYPTLISLGVLIPCILIALFISPFISKFIVSLVFQNIVSPITFYQDVIQSLPALDPFIQAIAQAVVNLLLFVIIFFLLRPLLRFVVYAQTVDAFSPDENDPGYFRSKNSFIYRHNALLGGIAGGLCAVILSMVITCPFMGALRVADDIIDTAESFYPDLWSLTILSEEDVDTLKACPDDLPGNLLYELGGEYLFHAAARTEIYGETVYLLRELETIKTAFVHLEETNEILKNPSTVTPEQIAHLEAVRDSIADLKLCNGVLAEYFSYCAISWQSNVSYYSLSRPQLHQVVEPFLNDVLTVCAESDHTTVTGNITTLLNMYIIILESEIVQVDSNNYLGILACMSKSHLITRLDAELAKNPNMNHIRISALGMQLLGDVMDEHSFTKIQYAAFCENISNSLNAVNSRGYGSTEEKVVVLSTYVNRYFTELGVTLPAVVSEAVASELAHFSRYSYEEMTPDQVHEFFQQYT